MNLEFLVTSFLQSLIQSINPSIHPNNPIQNAVITAQVTQVVALPFCTVIKCGWVSWKTEISFTSIEEMEHDMRGARPTIH